MKPDRADFFDYEDYAVNSFYSSSEETESLRKTVVCEKKLDIFH